MDSKSLLEWYVEAGVDEAVDAEAVNRLIARAVAPAAPAPAALQQAAVPSPSRPAVAPAAPAEAMAKSRALADACATRADLEKAVREFDGCSLKKTAMNTVFSDGNPNARVMIIGEAPGAQEDMQGIPFCGPSGKLLDRMFEAIGLTRENNLYISNTVFWRPPGNRAPSTEELAICEPFVQKHIALIRPALLVLAGGVASTAVLKRPESVGRLRGKAQSYTNPYLETPLPVIVTFHPSYLLRSPGQKKLAWQDLLMIREWLEQHGIIPRAETPAKT